MIQESKIAGNRVGVLIGKAGATKRELEERTSSSITINSDEGMVKVEGEDAVGVLLAGEVIRAINRGFSPAHAFTLLDDEDMILDVIELSSTGDTQRQLDRLRGRIIGRDGSSREQIETMTSTYLSVYGKTVAIIGLPDQVKNARAGIEMLIKGIPHESVFAFLDRKKKELKQDMLSYYY
ncbi:KH domain-containing protein [Methanosphaerula palustris]|uniref:KH type 1 domain protein n=1 Tax=Methanosphaerula palustris (strain ATCC BAA-1556 / DSM 19958 / E1-9c) TaxID=521011 RepID=B8GGD0_METPE|nr:KH domain-containing protein [Methanosphaerula palustris]ACL18048.1 KH type 1 domain protein [Methanosphaerula palustris E1-9c]